MLRKAKQISLVECLVNQIEDAIVSGRFSPGDKLPQSAELETMLGASRGTLREALRILEQKGLIEIKVGVKGGTFIREANADPVSEGLARLIRQRRISLDDLSGFRQVIEEGLIRLVAAVISSKDIVELRGFFDKLQLQVKRGAVGWHDFLEIEVQLRKTLIRISGSLMYEAVLVPIHENIFAYAHKYISGEDAALEEAYRDWQRTITALADGDIDTAVAVTQSHIARYAKRMKDGLAKFEKCNEKPGRHACRVPGAGCGRYYTKDTSCRRAQVFSSQAD